MLRLDPTGRSSPPPSSSAQASAASSGRSRPSSRPRHRTRRSKRSAVGSRRRRARLSADLRRQDADRMGRRPEILAGRKRRARRRDHARDVDQEQHLHHLARRTAEGLRAEARLSHHGEGQQRHQLPQRDRARWSRAKVRDARLPVRHRRRKRHSGNNYEEKGRLFLAVRGQLTRVVGGRPPVLISTFGDTDNSATAVTDDWNAVHLIARGNSLTHMINGRVMCVVIDDDAPNRPTDG